MFAWHCGCCCSEIERERRSQTCNICKMAIHFIELRQKMAVFEVRNGGENPIKQMLWVVWKNFFFNGHSCLLLPENCFLYKSEKNPKSYFLTFALREVRISVTGCTCLHVAANTNTNPSEGVHYFTSIFRLAEQIVTHVWEPLPNLRAQHTSHRHLAAG